MVLLMVKEKLSQQKHELYNMYLESKEKDKKDDDEEEATKAPEHLYK